uniref:Uncharacterized protein n=1 Tax=Meloidogyne javanica TaxID=6303 RepID=A0A915M198_MELJA
MKQTDDSRDGAKDKSGAGSSHGACGSSQVTGSSSVPSQPRLSYARAVAPNPPVLQMQKLLTEKAGNVDMEEFLRLKNNEIQMKEGMDKLLKKNSELFEKNSELLKYVELLRREAWTTMPNKVDKSIQEIYTPFKFIDEAKKCLKVFRPNLIMSSENAWGGFCAAIALFYKDLVIEFDGLKFVGINLQTHSATVSMDKKIISSNLSPYVKLGEYDQSTKMLYFNKRKVKDFICGVEYSFDLELDDKKAENVGASVLNK